MAELLPALKEYFGHEGLYSDDPRDPGGETWMGIARKRQPGWRGWQLIDHLRDVNPDGPYFFDAMKADPDLAEAVEDFYRSQWEGLGLGLIDSQAVAVEVFEAGQNVGPAKAVAWLQEVLNAMNRCGKDWEELKEDGGMGPRTRTALRAAMDRRGERHVVLGLNGRQFAYYWQLVRKNPAKWEVFFNGFLRRVQLRA